MRPILYQAKALPFHQLSPDDFEQFVFSMLLELSSDQGFEMIHGSVTSADSGFDAAGKRMQDKSLVCVQCKRLASAITLSILSFELAKVALNSWLEKSLVSQYLMISSGSISAEVLKILRAGDKAALEIAVTSALTEPRIQSLTDKIEAQSATPLTIVKNFLDGLEKIEVWSGSDFDARIGQIWSRVTNQIERYFQVAIQLREEPRPDFNRDEYLIAIQKRAEGLISVYAAISDFPLNLSRFGSADPAANLRVTAAPLIPLAADQMQPITSLTESLPNGWCTVLTGPGGAGKSTSLNEISRRLSLFEDSSGELVLPITIRLNEYVSSLDMLLNRSLNLTRGSWRSIPGSKFILADGLDEVDSNRIQAILGEIDSILKTDQNRVLITLRKTGLRAPVALEKICGVVELQPLTFQQARKVAESLLEKPLAETFLIHLRESYARRNFRILALPFGLSAAISLFAESGRFPESDVELLEDLVMRRLRRNTARDIFSELTSGMSMSFVRTLNEALAFEIRILRQAISVSEAIVDTILAECIARLRAMDPILFQSLTVDVYRKLAFQFEMLQTSGGFTYLGHDLISDYLASKALARSWRSNLNHLKTSIGEDAWVFASAHLGPQEIDEFVNHVSDADLRLAIRIANESKLKDVGPLESKLFALAATDSRFNFATSVSMMALLKTNNCIARLKLLEAETSHERSRFARRALAKAGHTPTLQSILESEEPVVSSPLKVSGGDVESWFRGDPIVTLSLARNRIDQSLISKSRFPIGLSLKTVGRLGDGSDSERLKSVVYSTSDLSLLYAAVTALNVIDSTQLLEILRLRNFDADHSDPYILKLLSDLGDKVDTSKILEQVLSIEEVEPSNANYVDALRSTIEMNPLPADSAEKLFGQIGNSSLGKLNQIWLIASKHRLLNFKSYAVTALESLGEPSLGLAINYLRHLGENSGFDLQISDKVAKALAELIRLKSLKHWEIRCALDYINASGHTALAGAFIVDILETHIEAALEASDNRRVHKRADNPKSAAELEYEMFLDFLPLHLETLESSGVEVPRELLKNLITLDLRFSGEAASAARTRLVSRLSSSEIDDILESIPTSDKLVRVMLTCTFVETTERRARLVRSNLRTILSTNFSKPIVAVLNQYWSDGLAKELVLIISQHSASSNDSHVLRDLEDELSELFTREFAEQEISPLLSQTSSSRAREVLQFWIDVARSRR